MNTTLSIRLPSAVAAAIGAAASAAILSRSAWVRQELVRALPGSELPTLPSSPPRRTMTIPPADLAAVSKLSADLSRTGGAIVQMTRALRENGHPSHSDAEAVLVDIRQTQRQLSGLITAMTAGVTGHAS